MLKSIFLLVLLSPGQVALSIWFLYRILDWRYAVSFIKRAAVDVEVQCYCRTRRYDSVFSHPCLFYNKVTGLSVTKDEEGQFKFENFLLFLSLKHSIRRMLEYKKLLNVRLYFQSSMKNLSYIPVLTISRMIKLFGWERKMEDEVAHIRAQEFISLRKIKLLELVTENLK